jgi:aquaporin related protein
MVIAGTLPSIRALFLVPAQINAAMCAAGLTKAMFPGDITLINTTLSPQTSITQGVFIEMFMTAELVFVVLMLAAEKSKDTFLAPIGIGLALFVAILGGMHSQLVLKFTSPINER